MWSAAWALKPRSGSSGQRTTRPAPPAPPPSQTCSPATSTPCPASRPTPSARTGRWPSRSPPTPLGHLPLDAVTRDDVAAWIRTQEASGAASKTIRNRHALLSAAFTRAVDDGTTASTPARRARISRTVRREMTFLTPAEFELVLQRATPHYRPLLLTLFGTGLRLGEATALQIGDLHLEDVPATLTVARAWKNGGVLGPPKTARGRRTIALPREVAEAPRDVAGDRAPGELVFVNMGGRRVQQATLHDLWQTWIDDTEWEPRTRSRVPRSPALRKVPRIHDLRHSHAAYMISRGVNLYDLRHRLGHESIQTTADVYGHLLPESQIQAARAASWSSDLSPSRIIDTREELH